MVVRSVAGLIVLAGLAMACSSGGSGGPSGEGEGGAESGSSSGGSGSSGASSSSGSGDLDAADSADATDDVPVVNGDASVCGSCGTGSVCVEDSVSGGALFAVDDAGNCPAGRIPSGGTPDVCISPPTYHCAALPSACNTAAGSTAVAHCTCASELCPPAYMCTDPSPTLMTCALLAP
jgi:hypothetical protein